MIAAKEMRLKYEEECVRRAEDAEVRRHQHKAEIEMLALQLRDVILERMSKKLEFPFYYYLQYEYTYHPSCIPIVKRTCEHLVTLGYIALYEDTHFKICLPEIVEPSKCETDIVEPFKCALEFIEPPKCEPEQNLQIKTHHSQALDDPPAYEIALQTSETTTILAHEHNLSKRSLFSRICCCVPIKFT